MQAFRTWHGAFVIIQTQFGTNMLWELDRSINLNMSPIVTLRQTYQDYSIIKSQDAKHKHVKIVRSDNRRKLHVWVDYDTSGIWLVKSRWDSLMRWPVSLKTQEWKYIWVNFSLLYNMLELTTGQKMFETKV